MQENLPGGQNLTMRFGSLIALSVTSIGAALAAGACTTDYQKGLEDPLFGAPNALAGQRQPGPSTEAPNVGGGGGAGSPVCVAAGGTLLADAGACAVSFKTDVLGALAASAPACSLPTCHGGANPPNPPRIDTADGPGMWKEFAAFKLSDGKAYINPCSQDDKQSGLACNLYAAGQAGACGTHMPSGGQLTPDAITKIETWLKCGSPNN